MSPLMSRKRIHPAQVTRRCDGCDTLFQPEMRDVMDGNGRFCSKRCGWENQHHPPAETTTLSCALCNTSFERRKANLNHPQSKSGLHFCSRKCKDVAQRIEGIPAIHLPHYKDGADHYRVRALRHYGSVCSCCGYNQYEEMLDVHHKDSDRENNKIENLEVLCVWCHALRTRRVLLHNWWTSRDLNSAVLRIASATATPSSPEAQT
jgi:hypothetical protein